jgi:hypothetical protein
MEKLFLTLIKQWTEEKKFRKIPLKGIKLNTYTQHE